MTHHYGLSCPFLNSDPVYAYGVEFGLLFSRMSGKEKKIREHFCLDNQEQILLLVNRSGWKVVKMNIVDKYWFFLEIRRRS